MLDTRGVKKRSVTSMNVDDGIAIDSNISMTSSKVNPSPRKAPSKFTTTTTTRGRGSTRGGRGSARAASSSKTDLQTTVSLLLFFFHRIDLS